MNLQALATLGILAGTIAVFALNRWRPDLIAFSVLLVLALGRLVSPEEALAGFGTPAVIALAAIFVMSAGLERTGAATLVSRPLRLLAGGSERRLIVLLMAVSGLLAGVMINLAAVGVLLPVAIAIAYRSRISPTLLLLPLAYAAVFGGKLTLIAGPSNLLIADILERRGVATLGLLDFLPVGLPMLIVGIAWMATVGRRLLPERPPEELMRAVRRGARLVRVYRLSERLFEARVPSTSPLQGKTIEESEFGRAYGLTIVSVVRGDSQILSPPKTLTIRADDRLVIQGRLDELLQAEAFERMGIELAKAEHVSLDEAEGSIVEVVVSPRSALAGRTLRDVSFRDRFGLTVLALWREGRPIRTRLVEIPLQVGDGLLIQGPLKTLRVLKDNPDFIVLDEAIPADVRESKRIYALLGVGAMIALTLRGVPVALSAGVAGAFMVFSGGLTAEEAYRAIDWRSIVVMGGMLALGLALEKTGATAVMAGHIVAAVGPRPLAGLAVILITAVVIGHFVPPPATTVLMAPLALDLAAALGTSALPFAMAIMAAMGLTLLAPFSNPVMLLVMSPGGYRLQDYLRSGLPLVAVMIIVMLVVIPLAFPF